MAVETRGVPLIKRPTASRSLQPTLWHSSESGSDNNLQCQLAMRLDQPLGGTGSPSRRAVNFASDGTARRCSVIGRKAAPHDIEVMQGEHSYKADTLMLNAAHPDPAASLLTPQPLGVSRRAFLGVLCLTLAGCTQMSGEPLPKNAPVALAIGYDITASTRELPIPTEKQLDELISVVSSRGGVVAFGLIADKVEPLTRLEVVPVSGRLDERARGVQRNRKAVAEWKERVTPKLALARDVQVTDFYGFTRQIDTLFRERTLPDSTVKVALLITDAVHTAKRHARPQALPKDVMVLAIGIDRSLGDKLFGDRILYFEDIASAIKMLKSLAEPHAKEA